MIINQSLNFKNNGLRRSIFKDQTFKRNVLRVHKAFHRGKKELKIIELTKLDPESNGYQNVKLSTIQIFLVGKTISNQMNGGK